LIHTAFFFFSVVSDGLGAFDDDDDDDDDDLHEEGTAHVYPGWLSNTDNKELR